jgi:hypothetical protein
MVELFRDKVGSGGSGGELSEVSASGGCQLPGGSTYRLDNIPYKLHTSRYQLYNRPTGKIYGYTRTVLLSLKQAIAIISE